MPHSSVIREAVGVFASPEDLQAAIDELALSQFGRQDISVLGDRRAMEEAFGQSATDPHLLEDNPVAPRGIQVAPEEKSLGWGVSVGAGILLGVGVAVFFAVPEAGLPEILLGGLLGGIVGTTLAYFAQVNIQGRERTQLRKGGLPLWVRTDNMQKEHTASEIMLRHGAHDVHIHSVPVTIQ